VRFDLFVGSRSGRYVSVDPCFCFVCLDLSICALEATISAL
jgi:hypothetical protein